MEFFIIVIQVIQKMEVAIINGQESCESSRLIFKLVLDISIHMLPEKPVICILYHNMGKRYLILMI